jgi:hypothetical protein
VSRCEMPHRAVDGHTPTLAEVPGQPRLRASSLRPFADRVAAASFSQIAHRRGVLSHVPRHGVPMQSKAYFLAAAFAARLNSRTLVSEPRSTMSATERHEPSVP